MSMKRREHLEEQADMNQKVESVQIATLLDPGVTTLGCDGSLEVLSWLARQMMDGSMPADSAASFRELAGSASSI